MTAVSVMRGARGNEKMTGKSRRIDCIAAQQNLDLTGTFNTLISFTIVISDREGMNI